MGATCSGSVCGHATRPTVVIADTPAENEIAVAATRAENEKQMPRLLGRTGGLDDEKVLLLVSDNLDMFEVLIQATKRNVVVVPVKYGAWSLAELKNQIVKRAGLARKQFTSVGLLDHGAPGEFCLLKQVAGGSVSLAALKENADLRDFFKFIAGYVKAPANGSDPRRCKDYRIDLLACNVAPYAGIALVDSLEELTGVNWAASNDATGNPSAGGDWELETDQITNVCDYYFERERVQAWKLLGKSA